MQNQINEFALKAEALKRLSLIADHELYNMAIQFVNENEYQISRTKMHKLKGLVHTIAGIRACLPERRIVIIANYLRNQIQKSTIKEDEKNFYNNMLQLINSDEGLRKFLNLNEFSDCIHQDSDGRKEKALKREKQNSYMYFIVKEFLYHVIAEKMKGI